jgi:tetratricopeptide (TPR) repeat protein
MKTRRLMAVTFLVGMALGAVAQTTMPEIVDAKYGVDSVASIQNQSLYRESFKQWKAAKYSKEAVTPEMISAWRYVLLNAPRMSEMTYSDGQKIMEYLIGNTKDKSLRSAYIDTLMLMHDLRLACFPAKKDGSSQEAFIKGRKGHDLITWAPERYEEAYNIMKDAVESDVNQLQAFMLDTYFLTVTDMAKNDKVEKMVVIENYQMLSDVLDDKIKVLVENEDQLVETKGQAEAANDSESVANLNKQIEKIDKDITNFKGVKSNIDNLFQPFASCEDLIKVFTAKMQERPDDVDLLKKITIILEKKDCSDSKLFLEASMKLYELEPTPESAYNLGVKLFSEKKFGQAASYFEQATSAANIERVYKAYRNLAYCYMNTKSFSKAREAARKAASKDPTSGEPYIIIGTLYAMSAPEIGGGDFESRVAYWAAVDKFERAKQIDPSIAGRANELIRSYSPHFPTREAIFFNDYAEGQSYTVGGWINESTTIRAAK